MRRICCGFMFSAALLFSAAGAHGFTVTQTGDPGTLVAEILGPGVTLVGTPTFIGSALGAGTFTGGAASGISMAQGIILASGDVSRAPCSNLGGEAGSDFGVPGDADLGLFVPGYETLDASGLEFDFSVAPGPSLDLAFNFVFASDEYHEYVDSRFNDVFGFFVDGLNIGLVPGTNLPVTVNTLNQQTNAAYYVNNPPGESAPFALEYDGFTKVITAHLKGIAPGTHHMKLVVADTSDSLGDSAVFIQAGSFSVELWHDATDLGGGWKWLSWFGYFNDTGTGWIYHNEHTWMLAVGTATSSIWLWTPDMGWLWSSHTMYPYLYRDSDGAWLWYLLGSSGPRWFNNMKTGAWESH